MLDHRRVKQGPQDIRGQCITLSKVDYLYRPVVGRICKQQDFKVRRQGVLECTGPFDVYTAVGFDIDIQLLHKSLRRKGGRPSWDRTALPDWGLIKGGAP